MNNNQMAKSNFTKGPNLTLLNQSDEIDFDLEQDKLRSKIEAARQKQIELQEKQQEVFQLKRQQRFEERDSFLKNADRFRKQSLETGIAREEAQRRLEWAEEQQILADAITAEIDPQPLEVEEIIKKKSFLKSHNFLVGLISIACTIAFFCMMSWIKVDDPEAAVFDATAYQKFFLVASLFSAVQLIKLLTMFVFYPFVYEFMNNEVAPEFDYGIYFKTRINPFQQICVATFLICWHSLEFILLYSVKF
jgi:hypothetical protein